MRKFLVMLMVVAMAFLFVGCIPITPPVDPEGPGLYLIGIEVDPKTMSLFVEESEKITSVTACYELRSYGVILDFDDCLFLTNDSEVATVDKNGLVTAKKVGTADIVVSYEGKLATVVVTVSELDIVAPKAIELKATAFAVATYPARAKYPEGIDPILADDGGGIIYTTTALVPGTWVIECLRANDLASNVKIVSPIGITKTYNVSANGILIDAIPGLKLKFVAAFGANDGVFLEVLSTNGKEVIARATILFDEDITSATADAATWTSIQWIDGEMNVVDETFVNYASKTSYYTIDTAIALAQYDTLRCVVNGAEDLAGNIQTTASVLTCTVGAASETDLKP